MKVVINGCFGGFGLSGKAEELYAKKSGFELFRYKQTEYKHQNGVELHVKIDISDDGMFSRTYKKDHGESFSSIDFKDSRYWCARDLKRDDPILIEVIEELREDASGRCAALMIVEIPDGTDWQIEKYGEGNCSQSRNK